MCPFYNTIAQRDYIQSKCTFKLCFKNRHSFQTLFMIRKETIIYSNHVTVDIFNFQPACLFHFAKFSAVRKILI